MIADAALLDAYSRAVVGVVDALAPTVVSLAIRTSRRGGHGSGFVVTPDGYALTNHHVIEKATEVKALLADGRSVRARVIGSDPATDLALVRLAAGSLEYVELEGGVSARAGQLAVAIGSPLGFDATVSAGIVSATDRRLGGMRRAPIENLIQHTAPLNPGNSGGPLADSKGRILGVNTAIIYRSQGIGFAVPAETAAWVTGELLARGHVRRSVLGIGARARPIVPSLQRRLGVDQRAAVEILSISKRSPAQAAGLRKGDLILELEGTPLESVSAIQRLLRDWPSGRPALLRIARDEDVRHATVYPAAA